MLSQLSHIGHSKPGDAISGTLVGHNQMDLLRVKPMHDVLRRVRISLHANTLHLCRNLSVGILDPQFTICEIPYAYSVVKRTGFVRRVLMWTGAQVCDV